MNYVVTAVAAAFTIALSSVALADAGPGDLADAGTVPVVATDAATTAAGGTLAGTQSSSNGIEAGGAGADAADDGRWSVTLDQTTRWAPYDGPVRFTV